MNKILILYTAVGQGHKFLALNIANNLKTAGFQVKILDILAIENNKIASLGTTLYLALLKFVPGLWNWLYTNETIHTLLESKKIAFVGKQANRIYEIISDFKPDLIITTQITASSVIAYLKTNKKYTGLLAVAFSDFHFNRFWTVKEADAYLVNIPEQKEALIKLGVNKSRVFICGMALTPTSVVDKTNIKTKLNINPDLPVVLMAAGSLGIGIPVETIKKLSNKANVELIIVTGNNRRLKSNLEKQFTRPNIKILGFYTPMQDLYAIADVFISKPGGLSMAEALRLRLPCFITNILPGQEKQNLDYLTKHNLVLNLTQKNSDEQFNLILNELEIHEFRATLYTNKQLIALIDDLNKPSRLIEAVKTILN